MERNVQSIQNRIRHFQREEMKVWRDLNEVSRQAALVEKGRGRAIEKASVKQMLQKQSQDEVVKKRENASVARAKMRDVREQLALEARSTKQQMAEEQRLFSQELQLQKRMREEQHRMNCSQKSAMSRQTMAESREKMNSQKMDKLSQLRSEQELKCMDMVQSVSQVESQLEQLEAIEQQCLEKLRNTKTITSNVLQELEASMGKGSYLASLLRSRQRCKDKVPVIGESTELNGDSAEARQKTADDSTNSFSADLPPSASSESDIA